MVLQHETLAFNPVAEDCSAELEDLCDPGDLQSGRRLMVESMWIPCCV